MLKWLLYIWPFTPKLPESVFLKILSPRGVIGVESLLSLRENQRSLFSQKPDSKLLISVSLPSTALSCFLFSNTSRLQQRSSRASICKCIRFKVVLVVTKTWEAMRPQQLTHVLLRPVINNSTLHAWQSGFISLFSHCCLHLWPQADGEPPSRTLPDTDRKRECSTAYTDS